MHCGGSFTLAREGRAGLIGPQDGADGLDVYKRQQYVQALRQAGFEEGEAGAEDASAGYLLHKGGTVLSAAVSEGQLGIYISPGAAQ